MTINDLPKTEHLCEDAATYFYRFKIAAIKGLSGAKYYPNSVECLTKHHYYRLKFQILHTLLVLKIRLGLGKLMSPANVEKDKANPPFSAANKTAYSAVSHSKELNESLYGNNLVQQTQNWHWTCSACGINEPCDKTNAMSLADNHDKEVHKKKPTSSFGWSK